MGSSRMQKARLLRIKMYLQLVSSSFRQRKSRIGIALFAMGLGAAVVSGLVGVYYDITLKMSREFRAYGANLVLAPGSGATSISHDEFDAATSRIPEDALVGAAPSLYGVISVDSLRVVLVGTWFDQVQEVSPYWRVDGDWVAERGDPAVAMVGKAVAERLEVGPGDQITLTGEDTGLSGEVTIAGIVQTGGAEDNQVFVDLALAQEILGQAERISAGYLSIVAKGEALTQTAADLEKEIPGLLARPVRKIADSEGLILDKIRSLVFLVVITILLSTLLCVTTTMMSMVIERQREIGLKRALGASSQSIMVEFLGEGVVLGLFGGLTGWLLGIPLAQLIGWSVFKSFIAVRLAVVPMVLAMSLLVSGAASVIPIRMAVNVAPALVLKGE